jgi:ABC-type glycerol-3-phosphate transport system substrate-binding protein
MTEKDCLFGGLKISRREMLRLVGVGGAGLLAAACVPAAPPEKPAEKVATPPPAAKALKVQLYTLVWQPGAVEATHKAVDDWNATNKDRIEVEYIQGGWGNARDYLTTSIAGGVVPEVIQGITAWANEYGHQGSYLDLRELIEGSDLATDIHPAALAAATSPLDKRIFSVPWCWEVGMMYVNADRFEAASIPIPEKGWTWDEFLPAARKLTKPPDYYGLAANLTSTQTTEDIIAWMWQTGAEVMGEIGGKWQIDLEPAREALQLWNDMIWKDNIVSQESFGGANIFEAFPLGTYSILQTGNWARRIITEGKPSFKWRMVPLPYYKRHANSSEPQTWSLATAATQRGTADAAWEVIQWMSNKENSSNIAYGDWLFPTRQSAMTDPRFNTTEYDWNLSMAEVPYGHGYPKHPAWGEFDDRVLGPNVQKYLQNELSLDELINLCVSEGTALIAQYEQMG